MTNADEELLKRLGLDEPLKPTASKPLSQKPTVAPRSTGKGKSAVPQRMNIDKIDFVEVKPKKKKSLALGIGIVIAICGLPMLLGVTKSVWQSATTPTRRTDTVVRQKPERPAWADSHKYQVREAEYRDGIRKAEESLELAASVYNNLIASMPNHAMQQGDYDKFKGDKASLDIWIEKRAGVRRHTRELMLNLDAAIAEEERAITTEFAQGRYSPFLEDVFEVWKGIYALKKESILQDFRQDEARGF